MIVETLLKHPEKHREDLMSPTSRTKKFFLLCACCPQLATPANPARRNVLKGGVAALGLGAAGLVPTASAQTPAKTRIDVHHHFIPPMHVEAMMKPGRRTGGAPPPRAPRMSPRGGGQSRMTTAH